MASDRVLTSVVTADVAVVSSRAQIHGFIVEGGTAAVTTAIIYDNTSAAGTEIARCRANIGDSIAVMFPGPRFCNIGIFVDITTTGGSVTVLYEDVP